MRKLLNTLYVTTQGAYLARENETVAVRVEHETRLRVPIHTLGAIVCFGNIACSPFLLGLCGEHDVAVTFLTEYGKFLARMQPPVSGNVLLRREQYRRADNPEASAKIARSVLAGKIANSRSVLMRAAREQEDVKHVETLRAATKTLQGLARHLKNPLSLDSARAIEGEAAALYFGVFDYLITVQKEDFVFEKRTRRPPIDPVNALLSFHYTLLAHDVASALQGVGLDPQVGFLHRDRPGRPSLALDLMEELRPMFADRQVVTLINRKQVQARDFHTAETGAVLLHDKARKEVLVAYQKRKQETITHPFLGEKIAIGLVAHVQALLLARYLRGDLDGYPPFFWK
jgi:CRISPR-associated protein Cas1